MKSSKTPLGQIINVELVIKPGKSSKRRVVLIHLAFTNWINNQLKQRGLSISNLDSDFSSGENLICLLEIIGDESLGRYTKNPKLRLQKIENCNKALDFIRKRGVQLTNIGAEVGLINLGFSRCQPQVDFGFNLDHYSAIYYF